MPPTWLTKKNNQTKKTMAKRNAHKKQKWENKPTATSLSIQQLYKLKNQKDTRIARDTSQKEKKLIYR